MISIGEAIEAARRYIFILKKYWNKEHTILVQTAFTVGSDQKHI